MIRSKLVIGLIMAGASLPACGAKNGDDTLAEVPLASTSARPEDRFGKEFGKAFRADPKSEPTKVTDGDMAPVSLSTEPIQID